MLLIICKICLKKKNEKPNKEIRKPVHLKASRYKKILNKNYNNYDSLLILLPEIYDLSKIYLFFSIKNTQLRFRMLSNSRIEVEKTPSQLTI